MVESGECEYVEVDPSGRYGRFKHVLGKGAMKTVYHAFDQLLGIEVAWNQARICDVLRSPVALEHLYSEVHLLSTLDHDSIMQFHYSWADSSKRTFNFITEMFTSGTLREYRNKYKHINIKAIKNWARQILHGLAYLHGHDPPVIHRDLKCDNIFINGNLGQVKIGDLGLAAVLRNTQPAHSVIGTPEFMAPELYDEEYNELVDVYSFGLCVLEMLTAEYPYSECSNPAQIYKKVTSGKAPSSLQDVQDPEAKRFISKCISNVSKRPSAKDLLLDPFLKNDIADPTPSVSGGGYHHIHMRASKAQSPPSHVDDHHQITVQNSDMKITGTMNSDEQTIFLRVQFADRNGHSRNIYFPFDIISDTPIDVANEMVKELDIIEQNPYSIAEMIDREISSITPGWKDKKFKHEHHHVFSYSDEDDGSPPPLTYFSSSPSSESSSFSHADIQGTHGNHNNGHLSHQWLRDHNIFHDEDEDTCSQSSFHSDRYSYASYNSASEQERKPNARRLGQEGGSSTKVDREHLTSKLNRQCVMSTEASKPSSSSSSNHGKKPSEKGRLVRNKSLSHLLHKSLVEEVNKRASKTVGTLEDIGYQRPRESTSKGKKSTRGIPKNLGFTWNK